jgi:ribulose-phosphate 3-epimerase
MIEEPDRYIADFVKAGADMITVHQEAVPHLHRTIALIRECGAVPGVALNPSTPLATLQEILMDLEYVLLMSVNPGFSGQTFIPAVRAKTAALKKMIDSSGAGASIEIDGGIGPANIADLHRAGVQMFVAGSAVFDGRDPAARARDLVGRLEPGRRS